MVGRVIVDQGKVVRASQLIASVGRTSRQIEGGMLRSCLAAALLLSFPAASVAGEKKQCSPEEAVSAEEGVNRLRSWADLHHAFKQFSHCDDGAIAEGYSDTVAELLAHRWATLPELNALVSTDRPFGEFVIRHIDDGAQGRSLQTAAQNARTRCPKGATALCSRIIKRVDELTRLGEEKP